MSGYTKLFSEIIMSTVWREPDHVRLVWITMLALKDQYHHVRASVPGLADAARVTLEQCEEALERLSSPDPYSRTPDCDGRRIEPIDGGWKLINGEKYRRARNEDERREYKAKKQREYRKRGQKRGHSWTNVDNVDLTEQNRTEHISNTKQKQFIDTLDGIADQGLVLDFLKHRTRLKAYNTDRALALLGNKMRKAHDDGHKVDHLIETAIERGWKTIFPPETKGGSKLPDIGDLKL